MKKFHLILSFAVTMLLLLTACNLSRDAGDEGTTGDPVADSQTQIAQAVILTQTAIGPATETNTFTPSLTPTITRTPTITPLSFTSVGNVLIAPAGTGSSVHGAPPTLTSGW